MTRSTTERATINLDSSSCSFLIILALLFLKELDERLGRLEEVLLALRLRALLVPVDDRLVADAVRIIEDL